MSILSWAYKVVGRLRAAWQQLPMVGTVRGELSLANPESQTLIERRIGIVAREVKDLTNDFAEPRALKFEYGPKEAYVLKNMTVWPDLGAVVDEHGRLVSESVFSPPRLNALRQTGAFRACPTQTAEGLTAALHIGPNWNNYYHWLVDSLPRVFALHTPEVQTLGPIKLLVTEALDQERRRLLSALLPENVMLENVPAKSRWKARSFLLLPFLADDCSGFLPTDYLQFFRQRVFAEYKIRPDRSRRRRILISRRFAATRRFTNQNELEQALAPFGFESCDLEKLPFAEQVQRFAEAECVVGSHGAGLTNLLYALPCKVLEIFAGPPKTHYRLLAAGAGHEYANLVGEATAKNTDVPAPIQQIVEQVRRWGLSTG